MTSRRLGQRRRQVSQDAMEIEPGEAPLEWRGDGAVVLPEGEEPGLELGERGEVVGVEHLALDDREVDLRLVQPTRMHGRMDDADRWPALAQAGLAPRALVGGAVVDDPEDPPRARVRLLAHDLLDEPPEGRDPGPGLAAPEHLRPMDVPGGEVGERALALVLVLDPARASGCRRRPGMDPRPGLNARLLVGADDVLVGAQRFTLPAAAIEIEDAPGFPFEVGIAGEDPAPVRPGPQGVLAQPAPDGRRADRLDDVAVARDIVEAISTTTVWRWLREDALRPWTYRGWIFPR